MTILAQNGTHRCLNPFSNIEREVARFSPHTPAEEAAIRELKQEGELLAKHRECHAGAYVEKEDPVWWRSEGGRRPSAWSDSRIMSGT